MSFDFASVESGDKVGYHFNSSNMDNFDGFYNNPIKYVHSAITQFDTYGDGMTQHSPLYGVTVGALRDCLGSLAKHISENPECVASVERKWPYPIDKEHVKLLCGLKYNSEKPTYYSLSELKKSYSPKKAYDRRWEVLPDWFDGSVLTIFKILHQSYWSMIDCIFAIRFIHQVVADHTGYYGSYVDYEKTFNIKFDTVTRQALDSITWFVEAYQKTNHAKGTVDAMLHNWNVD